MNIRKVNIFSGIFKTGTPVLVGVYSLCLLTQLYNEDVILNRIFILFHCQQLQFFAVWPYTGYVLSWNSQQSQWLSHKVIILHYAELWKTGVVVDGSNSTARISNKLWNSLSLVKISVIAVEQPNKCTVNLFVLPSVFLPLFSACFQFISVHSICVYCHLKCHYELSLCSIFGVISTMPNIKLVKLLVTQYLHELVLQYKVLFMINQHRIQYLYLSVLSCSHSLRYSRSGLVWALAGCWDI